MERIPDYFMDKMKYAKPHQFMQVGRFILMRTHEYLLYKLPDDQEVYGGDEQVLITDYEGDLPTYLPKYYNPKTKEWVVCQAAKESDWIFSSSNLEHESKGDFTKICYDSDRGFIEFDVLGWLHKNISTVFSLDEDFYYYGAVKFGETEYEVQRCFDDHASVKNSKELVLVCSRRNDVYNITEDLKRYFSKRKLPTDSKDVFDKIKSGEMQLEDFVVWARNEV